MDYRLIKPEDVDNAIGYMLIEHILESKTILTLREKKCFSAMMQSNGFLTENLIGKIHAGVKKLRQIGGDIKDESLEKIEHLASEAQRFANWMARALVGLSTRSMQYFKTQFEKSKEDCLEKLKKDGKGVKDKSEALQKELDQMKETTDFWINDFPKLMEQRVQTLFSKYLVKESLEDSDNKEGGQPDYGFISRATSALVKLPPFNLLDKVHDWSNMNSEKIMFLFSQLTAKLGGPGIYRFNILPSVCSKLVSSHMEGKVHHFLQHMTDEAFEAEKLLKLLPGVKMILETYGYVALFVAVSEVSATYIDDQNSQSGDEGEHQEQQPVASATHDSQGKREPQPPVAVKQTPPALNTQVA